jgi:hypothetical protein
LPLLDQHIGLGLRERDPGTGAEGDRKACCNKGFLHSLLSSYRGMSRIG